MSRIDLFVSVRILLAILGVLTIMFGLIYLGETLDLQRFNRISRTLGEDAANLANLMSAAKWSIKALPVTVLIGAIIALIDMQSHRELLIAKVAGISVWRLCRGPIFVVIVLALLAALVLETIVTQVNREINPTSQAGLGAVEASSQIWIRQSGADGGYMMTASSAAPDGLTLFEVTVIQLNDPLADRYIASRADYRGGAWVLTDVLARSSLRETTLVDDITLESRSTIADLRLKLGSAEDLTFPEVLSLLGRGISDTQVLAAAQTRFLRLASYPALLVSTLLVAFAFTSGYRRTNAFGAGVAYGIVIGLLVFIVSEMADRAGTAGVLDPALAAWGPALAAFVIGATVLLRKEDGRV